MESQSVTDEDETSSFVNDPDCESSGTTPERNYKEYIENEDTRSELKFDETLETGDEKEKRRKILRALRDEHSHDLLKVWQDLAKEPRGLVNDDLRRKVWPLLLGVDPTPEETIPVLSDLVNHTEYNQVVLDVNRSLKRFPPGIPYKQRLALQDQLTVLILRVIMKYPHLRYYQGYHDVAITFLLVVGETVAFRIMEKLSTENLRECMEPTMEKTSYRLNYIYPIIQKADKKLYEFLQNATVGTMFALPWYLTWFGHSLNQYKDVVRLYDYFLASPPLMPLYVTAALVIHRRDDIFAVDCDMATLHCLLSNIPDYLDFEPVLVHAQRLYEQYPPRKVERAAQKRLQQEKYERRRHELVVRRRMNRNGPLWLRMKNVIPDWIMLHYENKYGLMFVTATLMFSMYAYMRATEGNISIFRHSWNS